MNHLEFGPYSPQEIDVVVKWLTQRQAQFEILRNDQEEKEALMNDPRNVVSLAELRINIYLAQIYYIRLAEADAELLTAFKHKFTAQTEGYGFDRTPERDVRARGDEKPQTESEEAYTHSKRLARNKMKKATWAWLAVVILFLAPIVHMIYTYFTDKNF